MNKTIMKSRRLADITAIKSYRDFHNYLSTHAIHEYTKCASRGATGNLLAVCSDYSEAEYFARFPFKEIKVTGITPKPRKLSAITEQDPRISYEVKNCENLEYESGSFDLVFCKEGLHHLARPVLGLYEMLRVCRTGVIVIEPYDTLLGRLLELIGIASTYERNNSGNIGHRDNFVFRWNRKLFESILNSYYLESGYTLEIHLGWLSTRYIGNQYLRWPASALGQLAQLLPDSQGNYMTALIIPGSDIPPEPNADYGI